MSVLFQYESPTSFEQCQNELENFKKRLIYRSSYRGTKEMDILLSKFVNKYINDFDENLLIELENFLNFEDEIILNYYHYNIY